MTQQEHIDAGKVIAKQVTEMLDNVEPIESGIKVRVVHSVVLPYEVLGELKDKQPDEIYHFLSSTLTSSGASLSMALADAIVRPDSTPGITLEIKVDGKK